MFGIGFTELVIILAIALIVVGPERMPELARRVGTTIRDLRRMYDNMRAELGADFEEVERGIQTLRSLDPRRELDAVGRKLVGEMAREVGPDAESMLKSSPNQIASTLKETLNPLAVSAKSTEPATGGPVAAAPPAEQPVPEVVLDTVPLPADVPARPRKTARIYTTNPGATMPSAANSSVMRLGHDLLSDELLDHAIHENGQPATNGHEPA
jgi:Tat protein translocase TatB subunit